MEMYNIKYIKTLIKVNFIYVPSSLNFLASFPLFKKWLKVNGV